MGRTGCCSGYTTRSYNEDGSTNWVRNYFQGSSGLPSLDRISVKVDDSNNNVYTVGPCVVAGSQTWSAVAYDVDGDELWRIDFRDYLRGILGSGTNYQLDMYDVTILSDGKLFIIGQDLAASATGYITWYVDTDGTILGTSLFFTQPIDMNHLVPSASVIPNPEYRIDTWDNATKPVLLTPYKEVTKRAFYGSTAVWTKLSGAMWAETAENRELTPTAYGVAWERPTIVHTPIYLVGTTPLDNSWNWALYAARPQITPSQVFSLFCSSVCASRDGTKFYASANYLSCILGGVGVSTQFARVIPGLAYTQSAGVGLTSHLGTGQDNILWKVNQLAPCSVPITGGVCCAGGGSPTIRAYDEDDGSTLWNKQHNSVFDMDASADRIVTTGVYQKRTGEIG